jgi:hypothetical protein
MMPTTIRRTAMPSNVFFKKLNDHWNAEPNSPDPEVEKVGTDILLRFYLNAFIYEQFQEDELGVLRFVDVTRYRLGSTNDEGWHRGQCRFSQLAPEWGEFYTITGDAALLNQPTDWKQIGHQHQAPSHFLFYFRDATFECVCRRWEFAQVPANALLRLGNLMS